jgi:hypothetical protein
MTPRRLLLLFALLATGMVIEPASAAAPTFSGCGKFVKDNPADGTAAPTTDPAPKEAEIEAAWVDAGGGKPSLNIQIANLTGSVPPPLTSITYDATYTVTSDTTNFVRAYLDFSGEVVYEYGHTEPLGPSTRYARDGEAPGEMFPGEHGVVRIGIPPEGGGKPGTAIKGMLAEVQIGRTALLPGAVSQSPSRGLSYQADDAAIGVVTIGDCAGGKPGGGTGGATGGGGGTTPPANPQPAPPSTTPSTQAGAAPVKIATKKVKRAKARKTIKVKLKTTEPLTKVAVRLSKGTKVFGTGKLAKLAKTGTVKIKLKKAIKKGTYAFDVAGTDGKGARRIASLKLKVR